MIPQQPCGPARVVRMKPVKYLANSILIGSHLSISLGIYLNSQLFDILGRGEKRIYPMQALATGPMISQRSTLYTPELLRRDLRCSKIPARCSQFISSLSLCNHQKLFPKASKVFTHCLVAAK